MAASDNVPKILRIGVIQSGKVIEERLIRKRAPITFGSDAKNTFVFPESNVPKSWTLFDVKSSHYNLVFGETMDGRVSVDSANVDFASLKSQSLAQKQGDKYRMPLNDSSRGRVQFGGDLTILFHFVPAPPIAAKPELPVAAKGGWVKSIEPFFTSIMTGSFLLHALFAVVVMNVEAPPPPSADDVRKLIARVTPAKIVTPPPPKAVSTGKKKAGAKKKKGAGDKKKDDGGKKAKAPGHKTSAADRARAAAGRRAAVRDKIAGKGLLAMIGARGGGAADSAVASVFGSGSAVGGDLSSAIEGTAGVGIAGSGDVGRRGNGGGGGGGGNAAGIGDIGTGGGGKLSGGTPKKRRTKIVGRVKSADIADVDGSIDRKGVSRVLRRRGAAFQQCYESALKSNSKLRGKLVIEFTIGGNGRVIGTSVVKDGVGSSEVAKCVKGVLRRLRFPKPDDGEEVAITNAFVFTPGS